MRNTLEMDRFLRLTMIHYGSTLSARYLLGLSFITSGAVLPQYFYRAVVTQKADLKLSCLNSIYLQV